LTASKAHWGKFIGTWPDSYTGRIRQALSNGFYARKQSFTLADVDNLSDHELLSMPNFGRVGMRTIKQERAARHSQQIQIVVSRKAFIKVPWAELSPQLLADALTYTDVIFFQDGSSIKRKGDWLEMYYPTLSKVEGEAADFLEGNSIPGNYKR